MVCHPARSPSFSPTSKARHGCSANWATHTPTRSHNTAGCFGKLSGRTAASRWTRRATRDDPARSARLLGQVEAIARQVGRVDAETALDAETRQVLAALRERLGEERFQSELRAGAALGIEEAVQEALEVDLA